MITLMFHGSSVLFMRVCIFDCSGTRGPVHEFVLSEVWSASVPMGANRGWAGQGEVGSPAPLLIGFGGGRLGAVLTRGRGRRRLEGQLGSACVIATVHSSHPIFLVSWYIYIFKLT